MSANMTVSELKELLREAGLPVSGKKSDLIERLNVSNNLPQAEIKEVSVEEVSVEEVSVEEVAVEEEKTSDKDQNSMLEPRITKVTINIGVGEGGQRLQLAEQVLELLTDLKPIRTISKSTNRDLGTRIGGPIGCKVTIRNKDKIASFLKDAFWIRQNTLPAYNFDQSGNLSFGISDYTDFPDQKYNPDIGIFGMDVNIVLERPGHRVSRRRRRSRKVAISHRVVRDECKQWIVEQFGIVIVEE
jgi:large subunit ribosomal protein L5|tara:strand:+ start:1856 stop:2587 length:732 start_codon:yes stop_codon:yes gene_type:complete